jgi:hypothetical protein
MYVFHFNNPLLTKMMSKVFWVFPHPSDPPEKWDRLVPCVKKQVAWQINPKPLYKDDGANKDIEGYQEFYDDIKKEGEDKLNLAQE